MKSLLIIFSFSLLLSAYSQGSLAIKKTGDICKREVKVNPNAKYTEMECGKTAGVVDCNSKLEMSFDMTLVVTSSNKNPFSGQCEVCHNNGALKIKASYKNGRSVGVDTAYYDTGICEAIRSHIDGVENGKWYYFDSLGRIEWIKNYNLGTTEGPQIEFYNNPKDPSAHDTLRYETYMGGKLNGPKISYFSNGLRQKVVNYKNGLMDGNFIGYNRDTVIIEELQYKEGKKNGSFKYYYDDGELLRTETWLNGARDGQITVFYHDKKIQSIESYRKGGTVELEYLTTQTYECNSKEIAYEVAKLYIDKFSRKKIIDSIGARGVVTAMDDKQVLKNSKPYLKAGKLGMGVNEPFKFKEKYYVVIVDKAEKIIKTDSKHGKFEQYYFTGKPKVISVFDDDALIEEHVFDEQGKEISTFGAEPYAGDEDDALPGSEKGKKTTKEEKKRIKAEAKSKKKAEKEAKKEAKKTKNSKK
jgi:antitoxin component YwqK of YwqJK toxin-antitoxin module